MNMELLTSLFANLALVAVLFMLAKWFIKYDVKWWVRCARAKTAFGVMNKWVYLKIRLPKEVFKTPAAMEVVLLTLNQGLGHRNMPTIPKVEFTPFYKKDDKGSKKFSFRILSYYNNGGKVCSRYDWSVELKKNFYLKYLQGSLRGWSSLEIVSDAGEIFFLVLTKGNNKDIFKKYAYSQFPGLEIEELSEDPLNKFTYTNQVTGDSQIYVGRYSSKDGEDHIPIKTYVDYGLDKDMVKDEYKIDPLVVVLENMAQAKKGEMYWYQILIRPTIYNGKDDITEHKYDWISKTKEEIDKILGKYEEKTGKKVKDEHGHDTDKDETITMYKRTLSMNPTEKQLVEIMQRNIEKPGFDCVMKMFYWVDKKINPKGLDLSGGVMTIVNATKPFTKPGYGSLNFETITEDVDYPFTDPTGKWTEGKRGYYWKLAKLRAAFYVEAFQVEFEWKFFKVIFDRWIIHGNWNWAKGVWGEIQEYWYPKNVGVFPHRGGGGYNHGTGFVLNTEELATLWHFPGKAFGNTESKVAAVKADPPSNLPI